MYRIGHNRSIIGIMLSNLWICLAFFMDAVRLIDEPTRIVFARAGLSLLEFSLVVGAIVFVVKRGPRRL